MTNDATSKHSNQQSQTDLTDNILTDNTQTDIPTDRIIDKFDPDFHEEFEDIVFNDSGFSNG